MNKAQISEKVDFYLSRISASFFKEDEINKRLLKIIFSLLLVLSIAGIEFFTLKAEKAKADELSVFMKNYLWEMDDLNAADFGKILIETKGYRSLAILHPDNTNFINLNDERPYPAFKSLLENIALIRILPFTASVNYDNQQIGTLEIKWINENIFTHAMMAGVFSLFYLVVFSYLRIILNRREINRQMEEVQRLKVQQDGDYYLTSLLTKPLGFIYQPGERFKIETLVKQKKDFEFRKRKEEIGGDLCISDEIKLRGRDYIVYVNADAMGKSLQGAGGVLVFGSAFNSILTRNRSSAAAQAYFPEAWIRNAFVDLHKIFESFSGSMLMSVILGLIDKATGHMYWINAEHPGLVLYRDKKAELLDIDDIFRKLGTEGVSQTLTIRNMQLKPGDIIVAGSDGRDDLIMGKDEHGYPDFNADETLFLRIFEQADGDLEHVFTLLKDKGDISDDLSLLKIEYLQSSKVDPEDEQLLEAKKQISTLFKAGDYQAVLGDAAQLLNRYPENGDLLKIIVKSALVLRNFVKVREYIPQYLNQKPADTEAIYLAAVACRKTEDYSMAIAYGEQYRLRQPLQVKNFFHLYLCHKKLKNDKRANEMLEKVLNVEPENKRANRLLQVNTA